MGHCWLPPLKPAFHARLDKRARANVMATRFFQHESEVGLVEKFEVGLAGGSGCFCVARGQLITCRVAVASHTARRSKGAVALAIGFKRGIREKGRRRRAVHVRLFLKVSIGSEFWLAIRDLFPCASEVTRPLRAEQHVIFPNGPPNDLLELLVHLLCVVRQRSHANDLALEGAVEFQSERLLRFPWPRRCLIDRAGRACGIVKTV